MILNFAAFGVEVLRILDDSVGDSEEQLLAIISAALKTGVAVEDTHPTSDSVVRPSASLPTDFWALPFHLRRARSLGLAAVVKVDSDLDIRVNFKPGGNNTYVDLGGREYEL